MRRFLSLLVLLLAAGAQATIHYFLEPDVAARSVRVRVNLDDSSGNVKFRIPAWTPGYYYILNFQDKISHVRATDPHGAELTISHRDPREWTVANPNRTPITLSYRVLGDDAGLGFFAAHVGEDNAYVNGASTFVYAEGRLTEPVDLRLSLPRGWDVATAMDSNAQGVFHAAGYDEFIDQPLQLGRFIRRSFMLRGIPFDVIFVAPGNVACDTVKETQELSRLSAPAVNLFGGAPFHRYVYFLHLKVGNFSGGLEHRASNVIAVGNRADLSLYELATHEYFHAWNVKQIRPRVLGPFDYTQPVYTGNLWFAEGVTDYYAYITAYRSGLKSKDWLLDAMGDQIERLAETPARFKYSLEECSRRAWDNGGFGVDGLSYYNKGLIAGLLFDAAIRAQTHGAKSLDDVVRLMYQKYRLPNPGYDENGILEAINEVTGQDFSALYHQIVQSTEDMPYEILEGIGLQVVFGSGPAQVLPLDSPTASQKTLLQGWLSR